MKLSCIQLICTLVLLAALCLLLSDPVQSRRSGSSRSSVSRSRSSSRSSYRSSSRSRSRSTRSKIKKKIKKGAKKIKKKAKKFVKKVKKLPKASIKLPKITKIDRRLTRTERRVVWTGIVWYSSPSLRRTTHYVRYPCRRRFTECRENILKQNVSTELGYCTFLTNERTCLTRSTSGGCSQREVEWLRVAACSTDSNNSSIVDWSNSTWAANQVLKLTVQSSPRPCQSQFEHCRKEAEEDGNADSYCAMVHDHKSCLVANKSCSDENWSAYNDAACNRTAVNWADSQNYPPPSDALRLTTAVVTPNCQLELERCRENDVDQQTPGRSYCAMINDKQTCLTAMSKCSNQEWQDLRDAACNNGFMAQVSSITVLLMLILGVFEARP